MVLLTMGTILIGLIISNGWLDDFHNFIAQKTGQSTVSGTAQYHGSVNARFIGGFIGLWLMLQFLAEFAPELGGTLAGLILLSFGLLRGPAILDRLRANLGG